MPTIEELFRSKKLSSGKTAEEQYAVRNSKENELTSAVGLLGLPFKAATALRRRISTTGKETLVEQETTGLRVISKLSSPIIYGTKIARFTLQQSDDVEQMKSAKVWKGIGPVTFTGGTGLIGGLVNSVRNTISNVKSFLGVPQNIIPTKIYLNTSGFNSDSVNVSETMTKLAEIQKKGGGTAFGKLISKGFGSGGTVNQLGSNIAGATAQAGKDLLKNVLVGSGQGGQKNLAQNGVSYPIYGSWNWRGHKLPLDGNYLFDSNPQQSNSKPGEKYSETIRPDLDEGDIYKRNDLSTKFASIYPYTFVEKDYIISKRLNKYTKYNKPKFDKYSLENKLGLTNNFVNDAGKRYIGLYGDVLNEFITFKPDEKGVGKGYNGETLDGYDFVALKFHSITKNTTTQFRATITGLTETFAPTWDSNKFVGNPFNFYTYSGIERSVQFNFKVYSLSIEEHLAAWERLNFLASLVYPTYGGFGVYTVPPFLKFTLGNMYRNKECFIDSLIYTIDDNNMWEVGLVSDAKAYADLKLPTIIDVGVTLKFVENKSNTNGVKLYGFGKEDDTKAPPALGTPGNPVTGTGGGTGATPPVPTVPTIKTPNKIPTPAAAPPVVKKGKRPDGAIIPNETISQIRDKAKGSADKLLQLKIDDKLNTGMQMQAQPPSPARTVDTSTPARASVIDDSGTYHPPAGTFNTFSTPEFSYRSSEDSQAVFKISRTEDAGGHARYVTELYWGQGTSTPAFVSSPSLTENAAINNVRAQWNKAFQNHPLYSAPVLKGNNATLTANEFKAFTGIK